MAKHFAAKNQPIQKLNALFGLIVTKNQVGMAGQHARISHLIKSHLIKKLRRINLPVMIGPHVMNAHPKKAGKEARRPLHVAKRNLSAANQPLTSGRILAISHPLRCTDQISQRVAHHGDPLYPKNVTVKKTMHPRKAVKAH